MPGVEDGSPAVLALVHHLGVERTARGAGPLHPGSSSPNHLRTSARLAKGDGPGPEPVGPLALRGPAERGGPHVADDQAADQVGALGGELPRGQRAHGVADEDGGGETELLHSGLGVLDVGLTGVGGRRGLSLWPWPRWSSATARWRSASRRAVAAQWEGTAHQTVEQQHPRNARLRLRFRVGTRLRFRRVGELPGGQPQPARSPSHRYAVPSAWHPPVLRLPRRPAAPGYRMPIRKFRF